jgi:hypothetical protein
MVDAGPQEAYAEARRTIEDAGGIAKWMGGEMSHLAWTHPRPRPRPLPPQGTPLNRAGPVDDDVEEQSGPRGLGTIRHGRAG